VSGADPVDSRSGFAAMLKRIEGNGVRTIIVETASRFVNSRNRSSEPRNVASCRTSSSAISPSRLSALKR
jgi:hypothetical protein